MGLRPASSPRARPRVPTPPGSHPSRLSAREGRVGDRTRAPASVAEQTLGFRRSRNGLNRGLQKQDAHADLLCPLYKAHRLTAPLYWHALEFLLDLDYQP